MSIRLNKYLVICGVTSRRKADELIREGRVRVNGEVALIGWKVDPDRDVVTVDGKIVKPQRLTYIKYYKPKNVLTSVGDPRGRENLKPLLSAIWFSLGVRVFPVGRLDFDAEGLLLLTNDGELANRITHPKYELEKEYIVWLRKPLRPSSLERLREGVLINDVKVRPHLVKPLSRRTYRVVIHQGLYHVVKELFRSVGGEVTRLMRVRIGPIRLRGLEPAQWRELSKRELHSLKRALKLA